MKILKKSGDSQGTLHVTLLLPLKEKENNDLQVSKEEVRECEEEHKHKDTSASNRWNNEHFLKRNELGTTYN